MPSIGHGDASGKYNWSQTSLSEWILSLDNTAYYVIDPAKGSVIVYRTPVHDININVNASTITV